MKRYLTILLFSFFSILFGQKKVIIKPDYFIKKLPFGLTAKVPSNFPKIALVLSGGGNRGFSQIGVIAALEKAKIPIAAIVGTSMGSIIGGLYSAGYNVNQIDSIIASTDWQSFFSVSRFNRKDLYYEQKITEDRSLISFRMNGLKPVIPTSINSGEKVTNFLNLLAINAPLNTVTNFDSLFIPFRAISTNLISGKKVVLGSGSLSKAMRASSSVSFLLPPVEMDSLLLVDGGIVANIPVTSAIQEGNNFTIAVDVSSPLRKRNELNYPWEIADQLVSIPSKTINKNDLDNADIIIKPNLINKRNNDFSDIKALIKKGYEAADSSISELKNKLKAKFFSLNKEGEYFYHNLIFQKTVSDLGKSIISKFSKTDSISKNEILYQLSLVMFTGNYEEAFAEIDTSNGINKIQFTFKLNPIVKQISIAGIKSIPKPKWIFELKNKPYNSGVLLKSLLKILSKYRENGYTLATIKKVSFQKDSGEIKIVVDEGRLQSIEVEGNSKTLSRIITREFPLKKNAAKIFPDLQQGVQNLSSINLFKTAELKFKHNSIDSLLIVVKEKPTAMIRFGLRVDNENFTQGFMDVREENLFGTGTELGVSFGGGQRTRELVFEHTAHRVFNTYLTYSLRAFYKFDDVKTYETFSTHNGHRFDRNIKGEYRQQFYGVSIGLGTQVKKFGKFMFEAKYNIHNIFVLQNNPGITPYTSKVFTVLGKLLFDTQDKYPYPNSGMYFDTYFETAQKVLGGELSFIKFSAKYRNYIDISELSNLSFRFNFGFADNTLPLGEQFSLGGQDNFFGMKDYDYRGRQILTASLAYRYKLPIKIFYASYISMRYDLGSIWENRKNIRMKDLKHGLGATLSLDTPIGPADFSVGRSFFFKDTIDNNKIVLGPVYFYFRIGFFY